MNKKNILVLGSNGQLGSEFKHLSDQFCYNFFFTCKSQIDIVKTYLILDYVLKNKIDIIINCAAYTDVCNAEKENEKANLINNLAVKNLGLLCKEMKIILIHFSTDYVFDGKSEKPYLESDIVNPKTYYGLSKSNGEKALIELKIKNAIIIRSSWMFSSFGKNFLTKIISKSTNRTRIKVINDQFGTPTYSEDLVNAVLNIIPKIDNSTTQIYHYSNKGFCSWYEFAELITKMINLEINIEPVKSKGFDLIRPSYSCLDNEKFSKQFNIKIPSWESSLDKCLKKLNTN